MPKADMRSNSTAEVDSSAPRTRCYVAWAFFLTLVVLGLYLRYSLFMASVSRVPTNTDEALNMLMARDIARGNFPLLFWTQPYQFPLEAYLLALFINFLPPDAFGARIVLALISCASMFGFLSLYWIGKSIRAAWPTAVLILVPSSYFLLRQAGYLIPQYSLTITFAWLLPLLFVVGRKGEREYLWAIPTGLVAGMALSVHLLSLPIVAMVALAVCWGTSLKGAIRNSLYFLPSFTIGLIPYLVALTLPNAYEKVTDVVPFDLALIRLWSPILTEIVPATLGITRVVFPDFSHHVGPYGALVEPFVYLFVVMLVVCTLARCARIIGALRKGEWPTIELFDILIGAIWISLVLAALAGFGVKYRYLLPVAWYFPFLFAAFFLLSRNLLWRLGVGVIVVGVAFLNCESAIEVKYLWGRPHFADLVAGITKLRPLLSYFKKHHITRCYGAWWLVYRIPYESNGEVLCSQPLNERFPGWPLSPLLAEVDAHDETTYVFDGREGGIFSTKVFESLISKQSIQADRVMFGRFVIYQNFHHKSAGKLARIDPKAFVVSTSQSEDSSIAIHDGDISSMWKSSPDSQFPWIQIEFPEPTTIAMIRLYTDARHYKTDTLSVNVSVREGSTWKTVVERERGLMHRVHLGESSPYPGHPYTELMYGFLPHTTSAIRLEVSMNFLQKVWALREVEVLSPTVNEGQ